MSKKTEFTTCYVVLENNHNVILGIFDKYEDAIAFSNTNTYQVKVIKTTRYLHYQTLKEKELDLILNKLNSEELKLLREFGLKIE